VRGLTGEVLHVRCELCTKRYAGPGWGWGAYMHVLCRPPLVHIARSVSSSERQASEQHGSGPNQTPRRETRGECWPNHLKKTLAGFRNSTLTCKVARTKAKEWTPTKPLNRRVSVTRHYWY
jgi:hypothetical protein